MGFLVVVVREETWWLWVASDSGQRSIACGQKAPRFSRRPRPKRNHTNLWQEILHRFYGMDKFFANVQKPKQNPGLGPGSPDAEPKKAIPKGVVLGKDGKP